MKLIVVEIDVCNVDEGKKLEVISFKKQPESFFLSTNQIYEFENRYKIDSLVEKHESFFNYVQQLDYTSKSQQKLY